MPHFWLDTISYSESVDLDFSDHVFDLYLVRIIKKIDKIVLKKSEVLDNFLLLYSFHEKDSMLLFFLSENIECSRITNIGPENLSSTNTFVFIVQPFGTRCLFQSFSRPATLVWQKISINDKENQYFSEKICMTKENIRKILSHS